MLWWLVTLFLSVQVLGRPIDVGEIPRCIVAKAVLRIVSKDVEAAADSLQLCASQDGGCEAAVHAFRKIFQDSDIEAALLVNAAMHAHGNYDRKMR